jgi:NitT/TauT family transport system substrate-binding protein
MTIIQNRRSFLTGLSAIGAVGFLGTDKLLAASEQLETTAIRLAKINGICIAPQYVAEELLLAEGFTDVSYVPVETHSSEKMASGEVDFSLNFAGPLVVAMDAGNPITVLAGVHSGCFELFANETIRSIADLKGKSVGIQGVGSTPHVFLSSIAAWVGLDPANDINWITSASVKPMALFAEGNIDAFLGFPPEPQELRDRNIGHVVLSSALDSPWSHYFCCMLAGNADFVRNNPVATKRVLRAILKATNLCATDPQRAAQQIVDAGFTARYDYAVQALKDVPYNKWREYDPEDALRFYALRLHEAGMVTSSPQKIIAEGTDWRFINELKRELKA